jgi:hypothetical protein
VAGGVSERAEEAATATQTSRPVSARSIRCARMHAGRRRASTQGPRDGGGAVEGSSTRLPPRRRWRPRRPPRHRRQLPLHAGLVHRWCGDAYAGWCCWWRRRGGRWWYGGSSPPPPLAPPVAPPLAANAIRQQPSKPPTGSEDSEVH